MAVKIYGSNRIDLDGNNETFSIRATTDDELNFYKGANTKLMGMDASGFDATGHLHNVKFFGRGRSNTLGAISGAYTPVVFSTAIQTDSSYSNGVWTAPIDGWYRINWTNGNATGALNNVYLGLYVLINSTVEISGWSRNAGYDRTAHCEGLFQLSAGDYVHFCYHNSYGVAPATELHTFASVYLLN